jgi:DNA-directed RNA polymerase specialized sigma24 family protein
VLLLVGVAGLDHSDAADICGITPEALRQRLHRARETLSKVLEQEAVDETPPMGGIASCPTR